jgi:hypothetical protein
MAAVYHGRRRHGMQLVVVTTVQLAVHDNVPPPAKPCAAQVSPPKFVLSHVSPVSITPLPHNVHALVSN